MNFLTDKIRPIYFKYLTAAFGSVLISSIYGVATTFVVLVGRGAVISGVLIYLLPLAAGADSIWFVMPITELTVAVFVGTMMRRYQKKAQKM